MLQEDSAEANNIKSHMALFLILCWLMEAWWIICTALGNHPQGDSTLQFLMRAWSFQVWKNITFSIWLLLLFALLSWNKSMFYRKEKVKVFTTCSEACWSVGFPPLMTVITSLTLSYFLLHVSIIYLVRDSLSSGALKLNWAFMNKKLWNFSPVTLKNPFCCWSWGFLSLSWLVSDLLLDEPFCSNHKRNSHGWLIA